MADAADEKRGGAPPGPAEAASADAAPVPQAPVPEAPVPDATAPAAGDAAVRPRAPRRHRRRGLRRLLLLIVPVLVLLAGGYAYLSGGRYVETENAYVKADKVMIGTEVAGRIVAVAVRENEHVAKGALLFRIDSESYRVALRRAKAQLSSAANAIGSLKASYHQKAEELQLARANAAYAAREFERQHLLEAKRVVSGSKIDEVRHNLDVARKRIRVIEQEMAQIRAQLGGDPDLPVARYARYREAVAARDEARLNLARTEVRAPFAGVATKVPDVGQYVSPAGAMIPGGAVMAIVADRGIWIEANFKETDLTHVRPGQAVSIHVDTYPDHAWRGVVRSISQATGAEFSVIPPQNATGNWIKVVQRIPVRIAVETDGDSPVLRAGMSASVEIDTRHRRPMPGVVRDLLAWLGVSSPEGPQRAMSRQ